MTIHSWNGHKIEIESHALPEYLWFAIGFSVRINDVDEYTSLKRLEVLSTSIPFKIIDADNVINGCVKSGRPCSVIYSKYSVLINDEIIASGSVRARNWYISYTLIGMALSAFMFFLN